MRGEGNCTAFGRCGGCNRLDVPYSEQLAAKDAAVAELFAEIAPAALRPIRGMADPFHYRDKVIAPFVWGRRPGGKDAGMGPGGRSGRKAGGKGPSGKAAAGKGARGRREVLTGMYARGTHQVVPADGCLLENETAQQVVRAVLAMVRRHGIEPYDEDAGRGFLRHAVVRVGHESGEVLVTLVTNGDEFPHAKSFCRELVRRVPQVTSVVQNVNTRQTNVVLGGRERVLYGPGFILDGLCGMTFRISSQSFYQVNARQTEVLYRTAVELADLQGGETLIDAYCGTGTIGLVAAKAGKGAARLVGVDSVASSVRDARQNARHNGVDAAEFVVADAAEFLAAMAAEQGVIQDGERAGGDAGGKDGERAGGAGGQDGEQAAGSVGGGAGRLARSVDPSHTVLFMDPPRAGATPEFLDAACALGPGRIVYISCNPQTQARDVSRLVQAGYAVEAVQPVDMFPHTDHVECVVSLGVTGV